jgi:copper chaperone
MPKKLSLAIEGMHCAACVRRVSAALGALDGVEVELVEVGSASVSFNPQQVSPEQIRSAVDRIGFTVRDGGSKG